MTSESPGLSNLLEQVPVSVLEVPSLRSRSIGPSYGDTMP